jgi:universal stress protein A
MAAGTEEILVATDFSDSARRALAVGAQYARAFGAHIHLLHISAAAGMDAMQPLADMRADAGDDVSVTVVGRSGEPSEEILRYAASHAIDLIVMGTHGRTGVSRVLLGSVAESVLRNASCPVLVVPQRVWVAPRPPTSCGVAVENDDAEASTAERPCLVCATPTRGLICEPCRARIRGEALEQRQHERRPAGDSER